MRLFYWIKSLFARKECLRLSVTSPNVWQGRCSDFGGPDDMGVGPNEGLSCIEPEDLARWNFSKIFLPIQPDGTTGLARRLNPKSYYIAMRWAFGTFNGIQGDILPGYTREQIRWCIFLVTFNGMAVWAQAADWGPNPDTGRLVDCAPQILTDIGATTGDIVTVHCFP